MRKCQLSLESAQGFLDQSTISIGAISWTAAQQHRKRDQIQTYLGDLANRVRGNILLAGFP